MPIATTPLEWLPILGKRMDARMARILLLRSYSNGKAPMPEMGQNTKSSWEAFQKRARTDYGGLVCHSLSGRMVPNGVRIGTSSKGPAAAALQQVWRDNRLDVVLADAIWNMLSVGIGYLITGTRDGAPIITSEPPEKVITAPDPAQPWRARAAMLAWRDPDAGMDYAYVWVPGQRQLFSRKTTTDSGTIRGTIAGDWDVAAEPEEYEGPVPVYALDNVEQRAEFEAHIDVIDRINLGKLNRLVITAFQAFKARAFKNLPQEDEDGNDIDWGKRLSFAPGAILDLPEGIDIWESEGVDISSLLKGEESDARDFAAVSRTPISVFIPSGQNQSAEGAANAKEGEIQKAKDRIARASAPTEGALLAALRILGLDEGETIQLLWQPPEHVSLSEKSTAASQAKAAGKSQRWISENVWGMSPDEIAQEEADLAAEQLQAMTLIGATSGNAAA